MPPLSTTGALLNYGGQPCYDTAAHCNAYSACAGYGRSCVVTSTALSTTCTTGAANARGGVQYICDYLYSQVYSSAAAASGQLCYASATVCTSDPTNPCSAAVPCTLDQQVCGSGYALAANYSYTCEAFIGAMASGVNAYGGFGVSIFTQGSEYFW